MESQTLVPIIEEDPGEYEDIEEYFTWEEDVDELRHETEELAEEEILSTKELPDLPDYANDIRYNLELLLGRIQPRLIAQFGRPKRGFSFCRRHMALAVSSVQWRI